MLCYNHPGMWACAVAIAKHMPIHLPRQHVPPVRGRSCSKWAVGHLEQLLKGLETACPKVRNLLRP